MSQIVVTLTDVGVKITTKLEQWGMPNLIVWVSLFSSLASTISYIYNLVHSPRCCGRIHPNPVGITFACFCLVFLSCNMCHVAVKGPTFCYYVWSFFFDLFNFFVFMNLYVRGVLALYSVITSFIFSTVIGLASFIYLVTYGYFGEKIWDDERTECIDYVKTIVYLLFLLFYCLSTLLTAAAPIIALAHPINGNTYFDTTFSDWSGDVDCRDNNAYNFTSSYDVDYQRGGTVYEYCVVNNHTLATQSVCCIWTHGKF